MIRIFILILIFKGSLMAIEEPTYRVIEKNDIYEIRTYAPYLVAQTDVSGDFDEMGNKAFRILFKYISGENRVKEKIKMTAPVIQEHSEKQGQKIKMTAPVIQEMGKSGQKTTTYSFVMPDTFRLDTLPVPLDKRIRLKEIPSKTYAVLEYSGSWSEQKYKEKESILLKALSDAGVKTVGKPIFARYNSPFSLWFLRRNEIMIEVKR